MYLRVRIAAALPSLVICHCPISSITHILILSLVLVNCTNISSYFTWNCNLIFAKEGVNRVPGTPYKLIRICFKIKRHKTLLWNNKDKLLWKWNKNPLSTPTIRRWCSDTLRRRNCEIRFVVSMFLIVKFESEIYFVDTKSTSESERYVNFVLWNIIEINRDGWTGNKKHINQSQKGIENCWSGGRARCHQLLRARTAAACCDKALFLFPSIMRVIFGILTH